MTSPTPRILDLDFVYIELYDNYMISTIREGVVFDKDHLERFYTIFDTYYSNKPVAYISNRVYDYTVDPTCYIKGSEYKNLVAMAIWCHSESSYNTAKFEKNFYSRPFDIFYNLEDAKDWIFEILNQN